MIAVLRGDVSVLCPLLGLRLDRESDLDSDTPTG